MPIQEQGPVTLGTVQNLVRGLRSKPMRQEAVDSALRQAIGFADRLVTIYSADIAAGEVGPTGSGRASEDPISADRPPTTLMYGRVQSGKTAAMILTTALCLDNGFRIVVVITADNLALVKQTANRFKDLHGPRVFSSTKVDDGYEWDGQEDELREDIPSEGLVLVCAKDAFHLPNIIEFLQQMEAPAFPALVLDDEADAATPDTTLAARSAGKPNAPQYESTINRRIIENTAPGEEGESINEMLPHSLYVQVTATPFIFFLQREESRIRPNNILLLEPGAGYCGGEVFFGNFDQDAATVAAPPLVILDPREQQAIHRRGMPPGLAASIEFFILASVASTLGGREWPEKGFKHLSHTSRTIADHTIVAGHIERHTTQLRRQIRNDLDAAAVQFQAAYAELQKTVNPLPPIEELLRIAYGALQQVEFKTVNSEADAPEYGPRVNFVVGGNILGRGLTLEDLLVTYYVREAQVSQMDTVWQHARMYGYREQWLPYTRVYLPPRLAARFKEIHESEEALRDLLSRIVAGDEVPVFVASGTRPTRPNATEASSLRIFKRGLQQISPPFAVEDVAEASSILGILTHANVPLTEQVRGARVADVPFEVMIDLARRTPTPPATGARWDPEVVVAVLENRRAAYGDHGKVYVRGLEELPGKGERDRSRLGGQEIGQIQAAAPGLPVLCMLYLGPVARPIAWYPTLVMPPDSPGFVIKPR